MNGLHACGRLSFACGRLSSVYLSNTYMLQEVRVIVALQKKGLVGCLLKINGYIFWTAHALHLLPFFCYTPLVRILSSET